MSTSGGIGQGQIWEYDPSEERIALLFESPGADVLNAPDNITVSPRGDLVLCEDGSGQEFMHGLTIEGEIFRFAQNNVVLNGERKGSRDEMVNPLVARLRTAVEHIHCGASPRLAVTKRSA